MVDRPRVLSTMTTGRGTADAPSLQSQLLLAGNACSIIPSIGQSSCLPHNFNQSWAMALDMQKNGIIDYWLLRHDDIEIRTPRYLDILMEESRKHSAAVLSAVVAIRDTTGQTSTARDTIDPWQPKKLSIDECKALPPTFSSEDIGAPLLVNTGLILIDLSCPQWHATHSTTFADGTPVEEYDFCFEFITRMVKNPEGKPVAQYRPEDWELSRYCHRTGMSVYATTKISTLHHGDYAWSNEYAMLEIKYEEEAVTV